MAISIEGLNKAISGNSSFRQAFEDSPADSSHFKLQVKEPRNMVSSTYSFPDAQAWIRLPVDISRYHGGALHLRGLNLLSISEHRDAFPVTALGTKGIRGFTSGHKLVAGTMAFTIFEESAFALPIKAYCGWRGRLSDSAWMTPDQLPPFDLTLTLVNSLGEASYILIRAIKIIDTSRDIGIHSIQPTEVYSYIAASATPLVDYTYTPDPNPPKQENRAPQTADPFLLPVIFNTV